MGGDIELTKSQVSSVCITLTCRSQSRMAAVAELSFLLFALTNNIHAEELITIRNESDSYTFEPPKEANFCLISTFVNEGKRVLLNTSDLWSQNSTAPEHLKEGLPVVSKVNNSSYKIHNLTHSHSGLYQEQCWTEGEVTHEKNISIVVCGTIGEKTDIQVNLGERFELPCKGAANSLTVQWLQRVFGYKNDIWRKVFSGGTTSLMDNEKRTFEVMKNTSALVVSDYKFTASSMYTCLVMNKKQCVSSHPVEIKIYPNIFFHSVGERAVLDCSDLGDDQPPVWKKYNTEDFFLSRTNYTVLGQNDSLVFPSLTFNDSGFYMCKHSFKMKIHFLGVCPNIDPPAVAFFSEGEEVTLRCSQTGDFEIIWLMKSNQTKGRTVNVNQQKPDEGSRIKISHPDKSLVLSNVSLEDTGEYWCTAMDRDVQCVSTTKILLVHREPCGICSIVYTVRCSLLSGLLLTLCVAVVAVTRRTRRGEQFTAV